VRELVWAVALRPPTM